MDRTQRKINRILKDIDAIHSLVHPLDDTDMRTNLLNARSRREDAVRVVVLQLSLANEDLLDSLFRKVLVGHEPRKARERNRKSASVLDELLEGGRLNFESKIRLARVLRITTKRQDSQLHQLRGLRNRCAHRWMLDVVHKRTNAARPSRRTLEYEGRNLFDLKVLRDFFWVQSRVYLSLYKKYMS
jgi:hypothetical protein